jgi:hypothetical protein
MNTDVKTPEQLAAEKEEKDGQLRQADYTKKTQALAEERQSLAAQKAEWEAIKQRESESLEVARNIKAAYENDELVKAAVNGDKSAVKRLLADIEDPDEIKSVKKEIEDLKRALQQKEVQEKNSQFNDYVKAEGRKMLKDEFGLSDEELAQDMEKVRSKNNPYYTWGRASAVEKLIEKARQDGINQGKEEAIKMWHNKLNNNRPISEGNGVNSDEGESNTKKAAAMALEKLRRAAG